jgi:hypothetical protein
VPTTPPSSPTLSNLMSSISHTDVIASIDATRTARQAEESRRRERERIAYEKACAVERARAARKAIQAEANLRWALAYRDEIVQHIVKVFQKKFLKEQFTVLDGPRRRIAIHLETYIHTVYHNILGSRHNEYIKETVRHGIASHLGVSYYNVRTEEVRIRPYKLPCEPADCIDAVAYAILGCIPYICMGIGMLCEAATGRIGDRFMIDLIITLD